MSEAFGYGQRYLDTAKDPKRLLQFHIAERTPKQRKICQTQAFVWAWEDEAGWCVDVWQVVYLFRFYQN